MLMLREIYLLEGLRIARMNLRSAQRHLREVRLGNYPAWHHRQAESWVGNYLDELWDRQQKIRRMLQGAK
jgi:hypothetical protein